MASGVGATVGLAVDGGVVVDVGVEVVGVVVGVEVGVTELTLSDSSWLASAYLDRQRWLLL
jgi:hypothetical protein